MSTCVKIYPGTDWLNLTGVVGWDIELQDAILTALVTGQPLLFVGKHGSAKSFLSQKLASLLELTFRNIDTSKADVTDLFGYVSPAGLSEGRVEYVKTDLSLWGAEWILLDEISRSRAQTLNTYMEIIRSRTLQGVSLDQLRYVWAAMNPVDTERYSGTLNTLDIALLARFAFLLVPPDLQSLTEEEVEAVTGTWNDRMDAPLIEASFDNDNVLVDIENIIVSARARFPEALQTEGEDWSAYLVNLRKAMLAHAPRQASRLDGRTMANAHRSIIARRALEEDTGDIDTQVQNDIGQLVTQMFAVARMEEGEVVDLPFDTIHLLATEATFGKSQSLRRKTYGKLQFQHAPLSMFPDIVSEFPELLGDKNVTRLIDRRLTLSLLYPETPEEAGTALGAVIRLLAIALPDGESDKLAKTLNRLEQQYLVEDAFVLPDLADAFSVAPDVLDEDPLMRTCLAYVAGRECKGTGSSARNARRRLLEYCEQIRENPSEHLEELEKTRESLAKATRQNVTGNRVDLSSGVNRENASEIQTNICEQPENGLVPF